MPWYNSTMDGELINLRGITFSYTIYLDKPVFAAVKRIEGSGDLICKVPILTALCRNGTQHV